MSGFKKLLKSDTPTSSSSNRSAIGGQGSHFPKNDDMSSTTPAAESLGSTVTGTEPNTVGPSDTSAAPSSASQARNTAGPEAGGSTHVGTTSAASAGLPGDRTTAASSATPTSTTHSFPTTLRSGQDTSAGSTAPTNTAPSGSTGTAAVGQTTTYSSRPLASGDPTGSVVDHQSTDPLTYKLPESGSHSTPGTAATGATPTNSSGVTSSAAATAASLAWSAQNKDEKMPGEYPSDGNENPYRASNLDPRVDGGKMGSAINQPSSSLPSHTRESTGPAPSTLTTTADPTNRSAEYATSADSKGLDSASHPAVQSQSTPVATAESGEQQTMIGRTLGAIGLGGAASAAAGYLGYGAKTDTTDEPRDTSAVATQPGMVSQETGPPKHYRRESIPTTAYPGGPNSPRAVAPPVGGTAEVRQSIDQGLSGSNERGIGGTSATTAGVASGAGFGLGSATSGVPKQEYSEAANTRDNVGSSAAGQTERSETRDTGDKSSTSGDRSDTKVGAPGTATADAIDAGAYPLKNTNSEAKMLGDVDDVDPATVGSPAGSTSKSTGHESSSHTGRDIAAGGAAAAATGAGAHALQHHERSEDLRSSAAEDANRGKPAGAGEETLSGGHSYTITGSHQTAPMDAISSREPTDRGDSHAGRDTALGAGAAAAGAGGLAHASENRGSHASYYDATTVNPGSTGTSTATGQTTSGTGYNTAGTTAMGQTTSGTGYNTTGTTATGQTASGTGYNTAETTVHDVTTSDRSRDDHTARNVGLGAGAAGVAGGAAYAAHEHSSDDAARREREQQKEMDKQEKHHQKEMEKQEKKHDKHEREAAHAAEKREKARLADEEEIRKRHEREAAAGVGAAGVAGAGAEEHHEKEKKPSIFKRIFKRRQNKETGEDEDYSTDDEEDKARHATAGSSVPVHHSNTKDRNVLGSSRDETATGLTADTANKPRDSFTGLPYDPSKDPEAAARLDQHDGGSTGLTGTGTGTATGTGSHDMPGSEPFGYIGDTRR